MCVCIVKRTKINEKEVEFGPLKNRVLWKIDTLPTIVKIVVKLDQHFVKNLIYPLKRIDKILPKC